MSRRIGEPPTLEAHPSAFPRHTLAPAVKLAAPWLLALIVCAGQVFRGFDSPGGMATSALLNATALLLVTWLWWPTRHLVTAMLPALAVLAVAIFWAVAATLLSNAQWPEYATPRLLSLLAGFSALIGGAVYGHATGEQGTVRLLDRMLIVTCFLNILGVLLGFDAWSERSGLFEYWTINHDGRFGGMIGNANVTAAIVGVWACYAVGRAIRLFEGGPLRHGGLQPLMYLAAAILMLTVLMMTASRLPQVLTVAALLTLLITVMRKRGRQGRRLAMLAPALVGVGAVLWILNGDILAERVPLLSRDLTYRIDFWRSIGSAVAHAPATGFGLGSFSDINTHFLTTPRMAEKYWMVNSAHNIVLQLLVVGGWPYFILLALGGVMVALPVVRKVTQRWNTERGVLLALPLILLACSTIDIALDVPVTTTLFLLLVGLSWGRSIERHEVRVADA